MEKITRALAFGLLIAMVSFGIISATRVDASTIALLSGTAIGVLVAGPCAAAITWLAVRRREDTVQRERYNRNSAPMPSEPPQYWVVPGERVVLDARNGRLQPGTPAPWSGMGTTDAYLPRPRRRFFMIGESGDQQELRDPASAMTSMDSSGSGEEGSGVF